MRVMVKESALEEIKEEYLAGTEMYRYIIDHDRIVNVRKSGSRFYIIVKSEEILGFLYKSEFDILPDDDVILPKELFEI